MKAMVEGVWRTDVEPTPAYRAAAERSRFRDWVRSDGSSEFPPQPGRQPGVEESVPDHVNGLASLPEVYRKANPRFTGKVTVPALWDKERATIVNNESAEILRMFEVGFRALATTGLDLYPDALRAEIDEVNALVGPRINNGVYRAGFAATQEAYDAAVRDLFAALDDLEARLATRRVLVGERLTEADLRLFPTLIRFDVAYYGALRCNLKRLADYPHLLAYTKRILRIPGVAATVKLDHVKRHYWDDHEMINRRVVPIGPTVDFGEPVVVHAA